MIKEYILIPNLTSDNLKKAIKLGNQKKCSQIILLGGVISNNKCIKQNLETVIKKYQKINIITNNIDETYLSLVDNHRNYFNPILLNIQDSKNEIYSDIFPNAYKHISLHKELMLGVEENIKNASNKKEIKDFTVQYDKLSNKQITLAKQYDYKFLLHFDNDTLHMLEMLNYFSISYIKEQYEDIILTFSYSGDINDTFNNSVKYYKNNINIIGNKCIKKLLEENFIEDLKIIKLKNVFGEDIEVAISLKNQSLWIDKGSNKIVTLNSQEIYNIFYNI